MQPERGSRAGPRPVLEELRRREPIFHRAEFARTPADLEAMLAADFWEIGASGRRYSRAYVLETLAGRRENPAEDHWKTSDFLCRELARDLYLLTYTLSQGERLTRRATIWQRHGEDWKIVFHQGTIVQES